MNPKDVISPEYRPIERRSAVKVPSAIDQERLVTNNNEELKI